MTLHIEFVWDNVFNKYLFVYVIELDYLYTEFKH